MLRMAPGSRAGATELDLNPGAEKVVATTFGLTTFSRACLTPVLSIGSVRWRVASAFSYSRVVHCPKAMHDSAPALVTVMIRTRPARARIQLLGGRDHAGRFLHARPVEVFFRIEPRGDFELAQRLFITIQHHQARSQRVVILSARLQAQSFAKFFFRFGQG